MKLRTKNIQTGLLYFYIHFITEIACFYFLTKVTNNMIIVWLVPFAYDALAFVPQSLIGYANDKYKKINFTIIGIILLFVGILLFKISNISIYLLLVIICLGNCFIHIGGAKATLLSSNGKLSHSAIFVSGGSFGVITGKLLTKTFVNEYMILILILTMIPFSLLAETYIEGNECKGFNYARKDINSKVIILLAVLIVIVRGYMGYGLPTAWNKSTIQTVALFVSMGIGKCLGEILSDKFGIRKVAILSTILAIPFLCFGDNLMYVSLIGVMFFSMTMSITLAILVSVFKKNPGLAFGLTTIGLFLGTAPIFFYTITNKLLNILLIVISSLLCSYIFSKILVKENKYEKNI